MGSQVQQKTGFTIVELLIVIVIIAILATITVVAYNRIIAKAHAAAYSAAADTLQKQMQLTGVSGDPATIFIDPNQLVSYSCWGDPSDYPATADFAAGECFSLLNGMYKYSVNPTVMSQFKAANPSMSSPHGLVTAYEPLTQARGRGIVFWYDKYNKKMQLFWVAPDLSGCGRGTATNAKQLYQPFIDLYTPILATLKKAKDGSLSLVQAQAELEQALGEPLGETLTMDVVDAFIGAIEPIMNINQDPTYSNSYCQLEFNL